MITLTSFIEARDLAHFERWSGARWAPDFARSWPVAEWARPLRPDGTAIKLRDFGPDPLPKYREYVLDLYRGRWPAIRDWIGSLTVGDVALCCWCPYTKTARRQLDAFGSFHCHLGVVAEVLDAAEADWTFGDSHAERMVRYE